MRRVIHTWTESDLEYIRENYRDMTLMDMGIHIGVAGSTVRDKMLSMGLEPNHYRKNRRVWTEEEISFLKENFPTMSAIDLADKFGVSSTSVSTKAKELGLRKSPEWSKNLYYRRYVNRYSGNGSRTKVISV